MHKTDFKSQVNVKNRLNVSDLIILVSKENVFETLWFVKLGARV